jgi:hypothetical protein
VRGDVINLIPRQRAAPIIAAAGLANSADGRFAAGRRAQLRERRGAAGARHRRLERNDTAEGRPYREPGGEGLRRRDCSHARRSRTRPSPGDEFGLLLDHHFSTITMTKASWLEAVFQYDATSKVMVPVSAASGASDGWDGWDGDHFEAMRKWSGALMADTFA